MSSPKVIFAYCPKCKGDKRSLIVASVDEPYDDEDYSCLTKHRIIKCEGCEHIQFQTEFTDSEDVDYGYDEAGEQYAEPIKKIHYYPPKPRRPRPDWMESHSSFSFALTHMLDEAYGALDNDLPVLAAIAIRTAFDASTEVLGIHPSLKFEEKLDALETRGHIDSAQRKALDALTDAGSAAAHRAWLPKKEELDAMFTIFEYYIHHSFVASKQRKELEKRAAALAKNTPKKEPRPKKAK
jgi:hypothetical protein